MTTLPADLRAAIADGWQGLTLLADAPAHEPVTLVCAAPECRLRCVGACAFTVGRGGEPPDTAAARLLVVAVEGSAQAARADDAGADQHLSVAIDLAYREARELVERACAEGVVRIAWVASDRDPEPRTELLALSARERAHLRNAVARAGEWHTAAPVPLGVDADAWRAARRAPPRLVRGSFAEGPVALVVPAPVLFGADHRCGRVAFALSPPGDGLEVRVVLDGPPPRSGRSVTLRLSDPEQRRLAEALAAQRQAIVMGVVTHQIGPTVHVRTTLTAEARALILRAATAAASGPGGAWSPR